MIWNKIVINHFQIILIERKLQTRGDIENNGWLEKLFQRYIHLDEFWRLSNVYYPNVLLFL